MKLRRTTTKPALISFIAKTALIVTSVVMVVAVPIQMYKSNTAYADQYDDRIAALQNEIAAYQAESAKLDAQAATLQSALGELSNEKATIQAQIDISQAKYDKLVAQIADTEAQIKKSQDALGVTIANMYVDDNITPIEMIASSNTISDYLDKQEYRSSVRNELSSTISKIKTLKSQLEQQKSDVNTVLTEQKSQRDVLVAKENEQNNLLSETQGQESAYQQKISSNQAAISEAKATQALVNSRFNSGGGYTLVNSGLLGDYPWNASNCPMESYFSTGGSDGNGGDGRGYGCRQCASYVAWRVAKETGKYYRWGDAVNFTGGAINAGYTAGSARAGSIAVMDPGKAGQSHGHVAWVEAVSGGKVLISQYNYNYGAGYGLYSEMWLSVGSFDHYIHVNPNN